jgi:exopolyphosphatase/pppGpp-phosphohydrolase
LLIVRVNVAGLQKSYYRTRPSQNAWKIVDSMAKVVRLGEGLHKDDMLGDDAIDRAVEALSHAKEKLDNHNVYKLRAVATEACRRAQNVQVLIDRVRAEFGFEMEIISTAEEARLALTGCAALLDSNIPYGIVFDIGGGCTEVVWLKVIKEGYRRPGYPVPFEVIDSISLPYGVVTISETYGNFSSSDGIHADIREKVKSEVQAFFDKNKKEGVFNFDSFESLLSGIGGLFQGMENLDPGDLHNQTNSFHDLRFRGEFVRRMKSVAALIQEKSDSLRNES